MQSNSFGPSSLSITAGTTVGWDLHSGSHTVTIHRDGDVRGTYVQDTDPLTGEGATYRFPSSGTYHVFCKYHSSGETGDYTNGMVSTVTVA